MPYYRERHSFACATVGKAVSATRIDAEVGEWFGTIRLNRQWRHHLLAAATRDDAQPGGDALREQRRRVARAFADGAYTDDEYQRRLADLDARLEAMQPERLPELEALAELVADTRKLWKKALPHERRQLLAPLVDRVTICLDAKRVVKITPSPLFSQLLPAGSREGHA